MKAINKQKKRAEKVNKMTYEEIRAVVKAMKRKGHLIRSGEYYECTLTPNKSNGYAQVDVTSYCDGEGGSGVKKKVLVHHLWWRYKNGYAKISKDHEISHLNRDNRILDLIEEDWHTNQSRKWCHHFEWYKIKKGEKTPRCPHKEVPCKG
jgi:hypothetical protein